MPIGKNNRKDYCEEETDNVWVEMTLDQRVKRALTRPHLEGVKEYRTRPDFENQAFDFYGVYSRINQDQKYKYAETQISLFYRDICDELVQQITELEREGVEQIVER